MVLSGSKHKLDKTLSSRRCKDTFVRNLLSTPGRNTVSLWANYFNLTLDSISMKSLVFFCLFLRCLLSNCDLYAQNLTLDPSFGNNGLWISPSNYSGRLSLLPNQEFILCGSTLADPFEKRDAAVIKVLNHGQTDTTFGISGRTQISFDDLFNGNYPYEGLFSSTYFDDGRIVLAGTKSPLNTSLPSKALMAVLHPNGKVDSSFGSLGRRLFEFDEFSVAQSRILRFSDGDALFFIALHQAGSVDVTHMVLHRLNSDGSPDINFGTNSDGTVSHPASPASPFNGYSGSAQVMMTLEDKLLLCGTTYSNGFSIRRFNSDGSLDQSFGLNGLAVIEVGFGIQVYDIACQVDGKILVFGETRLAGDPVFTIVRLNPDGSKDNSWANNGVMKQDIGFYDNSIQQGASQGDGKVLAVGFRVLEDGTRESVAARYLKNGLPDTSFGENGIQIIDMEDGNVTFRELEIAPDHSVFMMGGLSSGGQNVLYLAKFQTDNYIGTELPIPKGNLRAILLPNIASSGQAIELHYELPHPAIVSAQLLDSKGRTVQIFYSKENQMMGEQWKTLWLREDISSGLYWIKVASTDGQTSLPIVVKR